MGLKCRVSYSPTGTATAYNEDGSISSLYTALLSRFNGNQTQALETWAVTQSEEFKDEYPSSTVTVDGVLRYLDAMSSEGVKLSKEDLLEVRSFLSTSNYDTLSQLYQDLVKVFKPNGTFNISVEGAESTGLYTEQELKDLDADAVNDLLIRIEGQLRLYDIEVPANLNSEVEYVDTSIKTVFGTFKKMTQEEVDTEVLSVVDPSMTEEEILYEISNLPYNELSERLDQDDNFREDFIGRIKNLTLVPQVAFEGDNLTTEITQFEDTVRNTIPIGANTASILATVRVLEEMTSLGWENTQAVAEVLEDLSEEFLEFNLDVIGLEKLASQPVDVMELLLIAEETLSNPTQSNIKEFSEVKQRLLPDTRQKRFELLDESMRGYTVVSLYSAKSDSELFDKGLIKIGDNLYHKVKKEDKTALYEYLYEMYVEGDIDIPNELKTAGNKKDLANKIDVLKDLEKFINTRDTTLRVEDNEMLSLYQVVFGHKPLNTKTPVQTVSKVLPLMEDSEYLRGEFVSDFYNYIIREKKKNSAVYRDVLSKFTVTSADITLVGTLDSIEGIELEEELKDYIRLRRDSTMDHLLGTDNVYTAQPDFLAVNFPETVKDYENERVLEGPYVVVPKGQDSYIKIDGNLYRKSLSNNRNDLYVRIATVPGSLYLNNSLNFDFDRESAQDFLDNVDTVGNTPTLSNVREMFSAAKHENVTTPEQEYDTVYFNYIGKINGFDVVSAKLNGKTIGTLRLTEVFDSYAVEQVTVRDEYQGVGVGSELYKTAIETFSKPIKSTGKRTAGSEAVWNSLQRDGFATKIEEGFVSIPQDEQTQRFIKLPQGKQTAILVTKYLQEKVNSNINILSKEQMEREMSSRSSVDRIVSNDIFYGFYDTQTGEIYLTEEFLSSESLVHELFHAYKPMLKEQAAAGNKVAKKALDRLRSSALQLVGGETKIEEMFSDRSDFKENSLSLQDNLTRIYNERSGDRRRWDSSRGDQTLEGAPIIKGATGADPYLTSVAEDYARAKGLDYRRQSRYVEVDESRAKRLAQAYEDMEHRPQDPVVKESYQNLIDQTLDQYRALELAGYKFYLFDETNDPYNGNPWEAMRDLRNNRAMGSFATEAGFGTGNEGLDVTDSPMLQDTGLMWPYGSLDGPKKRVLANDLFRAVHDAFGHGIEGSGFRARGEENAWQAHARLFTGTALAAITTETRGQNSWLNFGKHGEHNKIAKAEDTIFAPQKTGLMPEWTWKEGFDEGVQDTMPSSERKINTILSDAIDSPQTRSSILEIGTQEQYTEYLSSKFPSTAVPVLYKGMRNKSGHVHTTPGHSFFTADFGIADKWYKDSSGVKSYVVDTQNVETFRAPDGLTVSETRKAEEDFINNSESDVVVLDTNDIGGRQLQYVVKKGVTPYELGTEQDLSDFRDFVSLTDTNSILQSEVYSPRSNETLEQYKERIIEEIEAIILQENSIEYFEKIAKENGLDKVQTKSFLDTVKKFIKDFSDWVIGQLGLNNVTPQQVAEMTNKQLYDTVTTSMLKGEFSKPYPTRDLTAELLRKSEDIFNNQIKVLDLYSPSEEASIDQKIDECGG